MTNYLTKTGDGSNLTVAFEEATTLEELTTGEKLSSIFGKLKLAVKNLKSLISLIGTTDISTIGDGTITGGLNDVNGKLGKYKLSTSGFFSINLVVGSNMVSVDKLVSGSLPQTQYTLFTVISQGTSLNRLIDIFFDGDNNLVAYTNVAQRYSVMWVSFEMA